MRRALVLGMGGYGSAASTTAAAAAAAAAATAAAGVVSPTCTSPSTSPAGSIPQSLPPLAGTVASAQAVGAHLRSLYFECTVHADLNHAQAAAAVATFVHSLRQGDLALLHFSGYAASAAAVSTGGCAGAWLLPVDFEPGAPVDQGALSLDALLYQLVSTPAASVLVLLDAHPPPAPAAPSVAAALSRGTAAPPNGLAHAQGGQLLPLRSVQLPDDGNLLVAFTTRTAHHAPMPAPAPIQLPPFADPFAVSTSGPGSGSGSGPASAGSSTPGGVAASASPPLSFTFAPSPPGSASKPLQQQQQPPNGLLPGGGQYGAPAPVPVDFVSSVLRPLCLPGVHVEAGCMHANRALQHASGRTARLCWTSSLLHELILDPIMDEQPHAFNTVRYY